ncbi:MAG: dihydrodipicolinate synthase family protein [Deltaproteobacteria bacterium]|nr:dihydrodipicolinate synthase family protein [Deltaproteobacteria bacterium]
MTVYPPKGLIAALVTPFDEKGRIDWASLERLVVRVFPHVDGLLVGGGRVGEGLLLGNDMRLELLRGAIKMVAGEKPLFLCPTAATEEETLRNVEKAGKDAGQGSPSGLHFWVDMPLWYHSNRKLLQLYREWGERTPLAILLYNHPQLVSQLGQALKRRNIRTAGLKSLAESEQIAGMIYTGGLRRAMDYQRAVRMRRDFLFYDGDEKNFLNQPSSSGVVSAGACVLPGEWQEVVRASLELPEDPARNFLLLQRSQKLRALSQVLQKDPARILKFALVQLGVIREAKGMKGTAGLSSQDYSAMGKFLRENFSLQGSA